MRSAPASPGAVTACAMRSVSVTSMPSAANASATADLPLPMPPVRPTTSATGPLLGEVDADERFAPEQSDRTRDREIGTECERNVVIAALEHDQADADHRADHGRQQHDDRQHLPALPR